MLRVLLVILVVAIVACSSSPSQQVVDMNDSGSTIELAVGDSVVIRLHGNPTTGFVWLVEDYDETMIFMVDQSYTETAGGGVGAAGLFEFEFEATRSGDADVEFQYRRSWEEKPAERVFTLRLLIG